MKGSTALGPQSRYESIQTSLFFSLLQDLIRKGIPARFTAKGVSMSPFIKDGDVITVTPLEGAPPGFGDVVAFFHPGTRKLAVHRVVGKEGDFYFLRGDNSSVADGLIPRNSILGKVARVERKGKKISWGLGPERFLIAFFNGKGLFVSLIHPLWKMIAPIKKK